MHILEFLLTAMQSVSYTLYIVIVVVCPPIFLRRRDFPTSPDTEAGRIDVLPSSTKLFATAGNISTTVELPAIIS